MLTTIESHFYICKDCVHAVLMDDPTGLSMYYPSDEVDAILEQASANLAKLPGTLYAGNSFMDKEFSRCSCDLCNSDLDGFRMHCMIMTDK